jgi:rhodanese-related sulfurtransferase
MDKFDELLRGFDLDFCGNGKHKISFEKAMELKKENKALFLDVRTKEEIECVDFQFAKSIPMNEIPDRMEEIPKDKTIAIFCSSSTRATIVYSYLQLAGYEGARILSNSLVDITGFLKPGYVLKNIENLNNSN